MKLSQGTCTALTDYFYVIFVQGVLFSSCNNRFHNYMEYATDVAAPAAQGIDNARLQATRLRTETTSMVAEMVAEPFGADAEAMATQMPDEQGDGAPGAMRDGAHRDVATQRGPTTAMLPTYERLPLLGCMVGFPPFRGQPMAGLAAAPSLPHEGAAAPRTKSDAIAVATAVANVATQPNFLPDLANQVVCDHRTVQALFLQFTKFLANCQEQWLLKVRCCGKS